MCRSEYCTHRWIEPATGELTYAGRQHQLDRAWQGWVTNATITYSNANAITIDDSAWAQWNTGATTTMMLHVTPTAYANGNQLVYSTGSGTWQQPAPPRERTPEEVEADRLARAERRARREAEAVKLAAAQVKAEELLLSCLSQEQQTELRAHDRFHVTTTSGRRYSIHRGRAGNIRRPEDRRSFCIHDYEGLPESDTMLAQKLLLEADEEEFLRIANVTHY